MTALAVPTPRVVRNAENVIYDDLIVASASVLYPGALCCANSSNQIVPASDSTAILFLGIFDGNLGDKQTVTGDGTLTGRYFTNCEVLVPCAGTVNAADAQKAIYCTDDGEVTDVATLGPVCGIVAAIESSTTVWVRLGAYALPASS